MCMAGCLRGVLAVVFGGSLSVLLACGGDSSPVSVDGGLAQLPNGDSSATADIPLSGAAGLVEAAQSSSSGIFPSQDSTTGLSQGSGASVPDSGNLVPGGSALPDVALPDNGVPYIRILVADTTAFVITDSTAKSPYTACTVQVAGNGKYADISPRAARIKLRGNSTRLWYPKKPYRIKFEEKTEMLGLGANKDWVLLANFRDPTNFMNALAFDVAREMQSFEFVNANRFVEVEINGDYKGLYQLTEQVEQAESRVNLSVDGVLLSLDKDDGPELSPEATDNFWSETYRLPVAVKYPKTLVEGDLERIRADFKRLEDAIARADYDSVQALLDTRSFIDFLILQELTRNVELEAPRSMYLHKVSATGKYVFGPVWDFDGGYGYSWNENTKEYFESGSWILGSVNPSRSPFNCTADKLNDWGMCQTASSGGSYGMGGHGGWNGSGGAWDGSGAAGFFTNLFSDARFLAEYKARWAELSPKISALVPDRLGAYLAEYATALENDAARWPWPTEENHLGKKPEESARALEAWLLKRISDYGSVVGGY